MALRAWLRVVRAPFAPTAMADAVAAGWAAHALAPGRAGYAEPGDPAWALVALTSLLIYAGGMAANDLADRERDRVLAPGRPLPSGALSPRAVTILVAAAWAAAIALGGGPLGSRRLVVDAVLFAILYDFFAKPHVVIGAVTMGGVRFANAAIAVLPVAAMVPRPEALLLPVLAPALLSAATTLVSTTEEGLSPRRRMAARALGVLAFAAAGATTLLVPGARPVAWTIAVLGGLACGLGLRPRSWTPKHEVRAMLVLFYALAAIVASVAVPDGLAALGASVLAAASLLLTATLARPARATRPEPPAPAA